MLDLILLGSIYSLESVSAQVISWAFPWPLLGSVWGSIPLPRDLHGLSGSSLNLSSRLARIVSYFYGLIRPTPFSWPSAARSCSRPGRLPSLGVILPRFPFPRVPGRRSITGIVPRAGTALILCLSAQGAVLLVHPRSARAGSGGLLTMVIPPSSMSLDSLGSDLGLPGAAPLLWVPFIRGNPARPLPGLPDRPRSRPGPISASACAVGSCLPRRSWRRPPLASRWPRWRPRAPPCS